MAKLSSEETFAVVHKIHYSLENFAVHQAVAVMYCTQQVIQGENFHDWLKNRENRKSFYSKVLLHTVTVIQPTKISPHAPESILYNNDILVT